MRIITLLLLSGLAYAQGGLTYQKSQTGAGGYAVSTAIAPTDGQVLVWNASHSMYEPATPASSSVPSGLLTFVVSGSCPAGWTEASALNGKMLRGTLAANGDVGTTGGNATITPAGTVQQATLTGTSATTSAVSAGTPAGTNSTATTGATSGGTPAGTISALTTGADSSTTGGVAKAIAQTPTFTGSALGTHTHTVPAETFTGSALATHTHTLTATGTINAQSFTGQAVDPSPPWIKAIFCSKN